MTVNLPSTISPDFVATLTQAATNFQARMGDLPMARLAPQERLRQRDGSSQEDRAESLQKHRPTPEALVDALLHAEKAAKQQRQSYPWESLLGHWRLCFTTPRKVYLRQGTASGKAGFYAPQLAPAQISFSIPAFSPEQQLDIEIGNQVQLGPLLFRLTGPARYLSRKNLLAFDFTQMQLSLFGRTVYRGAFPRRKAKAKDFYNQPIAGLPFFAFFLITEDLIAARGRGGGLALWVREPG
jgi:hypothetical protein